MIVLAPRDLAGTVAEGDDEVGRNAVGRVRAGGALGFVAGKARYGSDLPLVLLDVAILLWNKSSRSASLQLFLQRSTDSLTSMLHAIIRSLLIAG